MRRICLRRDPFEVVAINHVQHVSMHPLTFTIVLEPVSDDGLRATALASRMGDENVLRWWVGIVRATAQAMQRGAWAIEPESGRRRYVADHWHTDGARELAAAGVPMLSANGSARFELDDLS